MFVFLTYLLLLHLQSRDRERCSVFLHVRNDKRAKKTFNSFQIIHLGDQLFLSPWGYCLRKANREENGRAYALDKMLDIFHMLKSGIDPGWYTSVDWVPVCEPKGYWFDSQSGHMPGLRARSPVGGTWEVTTHWCFSPSLSHSLPFYLYR